MGIGLYVCIYKSKPTKYNAYLVRCLRDIGNTSPYYQVPDKEEKMDTDPNGTDCLFPPLV